MLIVNRRTCLARLAVAASASVLPGLLRPLSAATAETERDRGPNDDERASIATVARQFMEQNQVPGLSVAFARHGQIVFKAGFGLADKTSGEKVTPAHLFRIASVSKPITSVAIFSLLEAGRFALDDLVFGANGLLKFDFGRGLPSPVEKITVHHLLTHTSGGWQNDGADPMFRQPGMTHQELITWTVAHAPLKNEPGTHYAYSNFGYCILGRIIEKFTQQSYADYVRRSILVPGGATDMKIAGNTLAERAAGEVVYYDQKGEGAYKMNVARMDSHGGWIATPQDLVQFLSRVDGFSAKRNILSERTIKTMTTPTVAGPNYACGWSVNQVPNWWHGGSLPGTSTIAVRTASGMGWAGFTNTRRDGIGLALDRLMWKIAQAVPAWRA